MTLHLRDVDIEKANLLKRMQEITVLENIREIEGVVRQHLEAGRWVMCGILSVYDIHFRLKYFANSTVSNRWKTPDT
ncbi:MAG: hypothetical protein U9Q68_09215 [Euryarchaeota archaeon]|nr:hypothetical protein [Euryarchaeota archaeon]